MSDEETCPHGNRMEVLVAWDGSTRVEFVSAAVVPPACCRNPEPGAPLPMLHYHGLEGRKPLTDWTTTDRCQHCNEHGPYPWWDGKVLASAEDGRDVHQALHTIAAFLLTPVVWIARRLGIA